MKIRLRLRAASAALLCGLVFCFGKAHAWQSDNGDGTYTNPVLHADYSDPDIIRVGSDFYMVSSTFVNSPGINLLRSKDMVNWELAAQIASTVDGGDAFNMVNGQTAYEAGYWAPSIRHYNGTFYVAVQPTFANGRIYYATNPAGPWSYYQLDRGIYDPGLFIDTNGTGYIVCGHSPQSLMTLNAGFSQIVSQQDNFLDSGAEGSHMVKRGSYYYVFNAKPSVWPFELRCSRTTSLSNPVWETRVALNAITGGHQGAIVDVNDSDQWFGFVHQDSGAIGRVPRIGPVFWENNWPIFGATANRDVMPATGTKPVSGLPLKQPATSDDFSAASLGLQWAWNHNPDNTRWSLVERPGYLRLRPTQASGFWTARNTLTQKAQGPRSQGIVKLDLSNLQPGDIAGFGTLGKINGHIAVTAGAGGSKSLSMQMIQDKVGSYTAASGVPFSGNTLYLRTDLDFVRNLGICSYSTDGTNWATLGGNFQLAFGYGSTFQGEQFALFCYNPSSSVSTGYVDVDSFSFTALDGNADLVKTQRGRAKLNAARTTFVADNGQPLRGPYESTEWTTAAPQGEVARIKELGFNTVHLYAESFDPAYPNTGSTAPGYAVAEVDKFVQMTRDLGLYLVITIGNGANNGNHNRQWAEAFWNYYAPRYKDETHVLYEIHNEPVAWGPPYLTGTTPAGALDMEVAAYSAIRSQAPNTPVLLFTYAVLGETAGANAALTDIHEFNQRVFGNANAVWTNEVVGFHGYAGWKGTAQAIGTLLAAGYPCMMTEFIGTDWGSGEGQDIELTSELERMGVSWNCFLTIPPYGVSPDVTKAEHFKDMIDRAGMSWTPDFGSWPVARAPYGNSGQPRKTTENWAGNVLQGALRIEAEDFDAGGQDVAYGDADPVNHGGQYRSAEGVDIEATADAGGGADVGWTNPGEWLEYTIWVAEPGLYDLGLRFASTGAGSVQVDCNGHDRTGSWALPNTGGWQTWTTLTKQVFLEFGRQKLRLNVTGGAPNLNWIELTPSATGPIADGIYKLVNRHSGLAMDGAGSEVVQNTYSGATSQQWRLEHVGAGNYRISSVADNDRWTNGGLPNDKIGQVWWWGADAQWQRFLFRPADGGFQRIVTASFGRELEPQGASLSSGSFIVNTGLDGYDGSAKQQWAVQSLSAPGIPTGLQASYSAGGSIALGWNAVSGASGYVVMRSTVPGGPYVVIASNVSGTTFVDTSVAADVDYYYVVSSLVGGVESLNSGEATAARFRAWIRFDESAGTTAADSSSHGWAGTLVNGPTWTTGNRGNAVNLDGVNDHVTLPDGVVGGLTDFTIATWVKLDSASNWARIFDFGTGTSNFMFLAPRSSWNDRLRFSIKSTNGSEQVIEGDSALPVGTWVHVAVTRSGNTATLYINGAVTGTNNAMTTAPADLGVTNRNYIGRSQFSDPYLDGMVDDFRIYERALSAADLVALMSEPIPLPEAPANVSATAGIGQVTLSWNPVANAAAYVVKRSTTSGGPYAVLASGVISASYVDSAVTNGVIYRYVIQAVNASGEGPSSTEVSAGPAPLPTALWLKFDQTSGTTATDSVGSLWNGTLVNGPTWTAGRFGNAVSLDGTDDHVTLPPGVVGALTDFTVSAWVKLDAAGTWVRVFDFGSGTNNYMFLTTSQGNSGIPRFAIRTPGTGEQIIDGNASFPVGVWTHLAVTLSGTTGTLYVNGAVAGTNNAITLTPASLGSTSLNYLGKSQWPDPYLDGTVDEFRIDGRALSAAEIAEAAQGLRAHLAFDESSGTTAADGTGHGWDGTLVNGPLWTAGRSGNAVNLDGSNDYVTLPTGVVAGLTDFTIAAWVKLDSIGTWSRVFDFGSGTNNYVFLTPAAPGGNPRFAIRTPTVGEQIINGSAPLPTGTWTHLAVTLSGTTGTLYVNGAAVGTNTNITLDPANLGNTPANYIGKSQWADPYLDGVVEDFRIYDTALGAAAISGLASQPQQAGILIEQELRTPRLAIAGGNAGVTVANSVVGHLYQLQYSDTLAAGTWIDAGSPQAGTGNELTFVMPVDPLVPRRFYRVRVQP